MIITETRNRDTRATFILTTKQRKCIIFFLETEFSEICYYLENIITLTPTQYFNHTHPNIQKQKIDKVYQQLLLLAKVKRVEENPIRECKEKIYSLDSLKHVLLVVYL